jgi:hypothetical protein
MLTAESGTFRRNRQVRLSDVIGGIADMPETGQNDIVDPFRPPANISCCGSEAGFTSYQSTRLSQYDADS